MPKKISKETDVAGGFDELEKITAWFERGDADIEEGLRKFERAMVLADVLRKRIVTAENTIRDMKKSFSPDGTEAP